MTAVLDLTNQIFGRLIVVSRGPNTSRGTAQWQCHCACGTMCLVLSSLLRLGKTQSCGCLHRELLSKMTKTHGQSESPEFKIFWGIITRCTNQNRKQWKDYGGRGIRCLFESFEQFYAEVGPRPTPKHTIERMDTNGHYAPGNVRWATYTEQNRNRRDNILVTYKDKTQCLAAWAEELHIYPQTLYNRYRKHKILIY